MVYFFFLQESEHAYSICNTVSEYLLHEKQGALERHFENKVSRNTEQSIFGIICLDVEVILLCL